MTVTTTVPRVWYAGDPEPPVGTTALRADGVPVTRWRLGWMPGPYNWVGITSLGPVTEVKPPAVPVRYELVEKDTRKRADHRTGGGIHPSIVAHVDQVRAGQAESDPDDVGFEPLDGADAGIAYSTDPTDY